jgi:ribulose-phosphate 3-epimerase
MFSLAPSLMCANLLELGSQIRELERAGARLFHIDVMDGHFVPNLGLSFDLVRQVQSITDAELDVHLMVDAPEKYVDRIRALKISYASFHIEAAQAPLRLAQAFKEAGTKVGIAVNPATPVEALRHVLDACDYVLIMTVEPGFAGQKFIPAMYEKIRKVRQELDKIRLGTDIQVDGNLNAETSSRCIERGATVLVGGSSSIFCGERDVYSAYTEFRERVSKLCEEGERMTIPRDLPKVNR